MIGVDLHLIVDNYTTHKHAEIRAWLAKQPQFDIYFTPNIILWKYIGERFFRDLTVDVVRDGSFTIVKKLSYATINYLAERNRYPTGYKWPVDRAETLAKIMRAREKAGILV